MGKNQRPELFLEMQEMVVRTVLGIADLPVNVRQDNVQLPLIVNGQVGKNLEHAQNHVGEELKPGEELRMGDDHVKERKLINKTATLIHVHFKVNKMLHLNISKYNFSKLKSDHIGKSECGNNGVLY